MHRVEMFLNLTRDADLLGWDEILQGGLAPDTTVMFVAFEVSKKTLRPPCRHQA